MTAGRMDDTTPEATTEWWDAEPPEEAEVPAKNDSPREVPPIPSEPPAAAPESSESGSEKPEAPPRRARSMAVKVVGGVAGAVVVGALVISSISGGKNDTGKPSTPVTVEQQGGDLPPAGGGALEEDFPAAGAAPEEAQPQNAAPQAEQPRQTVTLTADPSGKGRVGAVVNISIRNDTDKRLTVMATLIQGDGRSAVVGEGTLAPGSRIIDPGQTAEGTVEFSVSMTPRQVALLDLSGNVVAASN